MILGVYKPLGVVFEGKSSKEKIKFSPLRIMREIIVTLIIFFSVFNKISPLLPVDVGTLAEPR